MSFKDKYCGMTGLSHAPHKKESSEVSKIMRSKHAKGGSPRSEHYLGEGVINKVKGAVKGVKEGINTAKDVYKTGKELYGHAKKGISEGKKFYSENKEHVKNAISEGKKIYSEHGKPAADKAKEAVGIIKKAVHRKKGGAIMKESMTGAGYKKSGPSHKYKEGMEREDHSFGGILGGFSSTMPGSNGRKRHAKGGKPCMERENHSIGALAGPAMTLAKMAAPAVIGWGTTKLLNKMNSKKKFKGGQIKESRTAAHFKLKEKNTEMKSRGGRTTRAAGGVGKIRHDQYDN